MFEFAYSHGSPPDSPEDMRNALASFMRLERPLTSFDRVSVAYLQRFTAHVSIFRAFSEHLEMMRHDRLARLEGAHRHLDVAMMHRLENPDVRALVEDVRTQTYHSCLEGRAPSS